MDPQEFKKRLENTSLYAAFGGGVGRFGANFSVFHYAQTTIWIDVGAGFENSSCPGVQKILPNIELAYIFPPNIVILTHAHEDHIGAFPFFVGLLPKNTLIVTSEFTFSVLKQRLMESQISVQNFDFKIIKENISFTIKNFLFSFFFMPHSIPQVFSVGLYIKSLDKKIYFTSDFKTMGIEPRYKPEEIKEYAPVDFLFCDSTGSISEGFTSEENVVTKNLEKVIQDFKGRIFITTFSSHVERLRTIFELGNKYQRKVGLLGRSLHFYLEAAFHSKEFHIKIKDLKQPSNNDNKAIWIVSGCQADENSSLNRLSKDDLHRVSLRPTDTLLYSSSIIPGSEESVYSALNRIAQKKVNIIGLSREKLDLHASGHGKRKDILKLISWLKPKTIVPVHGDHLHFISFFEFIKDTNVRIIESNHIYKLDSEISDEFMVENKRGFVEGAEVHHDQKMLQIRKGMGSEGICNVILKRNSLKLLNVNYTGVMSDDFYKEHEDKLYQEIYNIVLKVTSNRTLKKEKKLKEKIFKYNQLRLKKTPYVNIILL